MTSAQIEFHVEGPAAEDLAMELFELLEKRLGVTPRVERPPPPDGAQHRSIDLAMAVSVISLVVSLPSAALGTIQLVEWIQKRRQVSAAASADARTVRVVIRGSDETAILDEPDAKAAVALLPHAAGKER